MKMRKASKIANEELDEMFNSEEAYYKFINKHNIEPGKNPFTNENPLRRKKVMQGMAYAFTTIALVFAAVGITYKVTMDGVFKDGFQSTIIYSKSVAVAREQISEQYGVTISSKSINYMFCDNSILNVLTYESDLFFQIYTTTNKRFKVAINSNLLRVNIDTNYEASVIEYYENVLHEEFNVSFYHEDKLINILNFQI